MLTVGNLHVVFTDCQRYMHSHAHQQCIYLTQRTLCSLGIPQCIFKRSNQKSNTIRSVAISHSSQSSLLTAATRVRPWKSLWLFLVAAQRGPACCALFTSEMFQSLTDSTCVCVRCASNAGIFMQSIKCRTSLDLYINPRKIMILQPQRSKAKWNTVKHVLQTYILDHPYNNN